MTSEPFVPNAFVCRSLQFQFTGCLKLHQREVHSSLSNAFNFYTSLEFKPYYVFPRIAKSLCCVGVPVTLETGSGIRSLIQICTEHPRDAEVNQACKGYAHIFVVPVIVSSSFPGMPGSF